ncbi:MAG: hypothetical protein KBS45_04160 [Clostridiales bacterium]|nr:hypothetical protein [Candidatus Coliplasma caballi]
MERNVHNLWFAAKARKIAKMQEIGMKMQEKCKIREKSVEKQQNSEGKSKRRSDFYAKGLQKNEREVLTP